MNWFKIILDIVPIADILDYVHSWLKNMAEESPEKWDDILVEIVGSVFEKIKEILDADNNNDT